MLFGLHSLAKHTVRLDFVLQYRDQFLETLCFEFHIGASAFLRLELCFKSVAHGVELSLKFDPRVARAGELRLERTELFFELVLVRRLHGEVSAGAFELSLKFDPRVASAGELKLERAELFLELARLRSFPREIRTHFVELSRERILRRTHAGEFGFDDFFSPSRRE